MTKRNKKRSNLVQNIFIGLLFVVGLLVLLYPTISDTWNHYRNQSLISNYEQTLSKLAPEDYSKLWQEAREYNDKHVVNVFSDTFNDEDYELTHPYDQLLNPTGDNIMGYIDVPKLGQKLAIGHGTGAYILERGVGHVEGTSLPIGGPSTHAVLAGHRGLPSAKIFSDMDQIIIGDKFFLYILDDVLAYEIDQIEIVLPDEADLLQIEKGKDYVTLLTCTPYGVNSHRMLVRGHRIPYEPEDIIEQRNERRINDRDKPILFAVAGLILLFLIIVIMKIIASKKRRKKEEEIKNAEIEKMKKTADDAVKQAEKAVEAAEEAHEAALQAQTSDRKDSIDQAVIDAEIAAKKAKIARNNTKKIVQEEDRSKRTIDYLFEEDKRKEE